MLVGVQKNHTVVVDSSSAISQKLKLYQPYGPVILLLGMYLKQLKTAP